MHSANIGDISFSLEILVRTITELHQVLHLVLLVTLKLELTLDWLRAAHGTRHIHDVDTGCIFFPSSFLVLNLGSSLNDVVNSFGFWLLSLLDANLISSVAELTAPDLSLVILNDLIVLLRLELFLLDLTLRIENGIAFLAENRVTCGDFCVVFEGT